MARRHKWSADEDATIVDMRQEGASWAAIGAWIDVTPGTVMDRARVLGVRDLPSAYRQRQATPVTPAPDPERDPLPAGDPVSWGAITKSTTLAGEPYRRTA